MRLKRPEKPVEDPVKRSERLLRVSDTDLLLMTETAIMNAGQFLSQAMMSSGMDGTIALEQAMAQLKTALLTAQEVKDRRP